MEYQCYCCESEATRKMVIEPSGDSFLLCCDNEACSDHIRKMLSDPKFREEADEQEFRRTHQGRSRKNYEASAKTTLIAVGILGAVMTAFAVYKILQMCGIC